MSSEQEKKIELEGYIKHKDQAASHSFYSIQRFDLLIISISGASIYIIFEILRFIKASDFNLGLYSLKIAGILFTLAIISNFISQLTSYNANRNEERWSISKAREITKGENNESKIDTLNDKVILFNNWTLGLNITSASLMLIGVSLLLYFNLYNF